MKFQLFCFSALLAAVVTAADTQQQRGLATLAEKWNLTEPTFAYDSNTFNLSFPVTDFINTGMPQYSLWTAPDCQEGNEPLDSNPLWASHTILENDDLAAANNFPGTQLDSGEFNGREAVVMAAFDPETISSSSIYSEQTIDNQVVAEIRFCIRFGLWTVAAQNINTPVEVNFIETLITLTVDLTDGFEIGSIAVEPKDRLVRTANQAYEVRGFECNEDNTPLSDVDKTRPRNQGEVINVCVTPEDEAQEDGIFMRSVDDFTFTRGVEVRQLAIADNRPAGNLLTSYDYIACEGSLVCRFSTILFAQFYTTPGTVTGEGVASMQFGSSNTGNVRKLRASSGSMERDLQEDGAGAAEFDLDFQVNQAAVTGSGAVSTFSSVIAAFVFSGLVALL